MMKPFFPAALIAVSLLAGCETSDREPRREVVKVAPGPTSFTEHIAPIFEHRCIRCHNNELAAVGLNLQDGESAIAGESTRTGQRFIVPGQPEQSLLYLAIIRPEEHSRIMMPADGWGLNETQENHVYNWIKLGAQWPGGRAGELEQKSLEIEFDDYL